MEYFWRALEHAFKLIIGLDRDVLVITLTSLKISTTAILLASAVGIPIGFVVGISKFKGRGIIITLFNTLVALPTVVIGLCGYTLMSRRGLLGPLGLLYTPIAMVLGQCVLAIPTILALTVSATQSVDPRVRRTALTLGASSARSALTVFAEARFALSAAVITGFGRIIGEVGASMMLGGNIKGSTRNIPTAIALETSKGEFELGIALGLILMFVALGVNFFLRLLQSKRL